MNYIFDVDGTLTPSRDKMDPEFREFFVDWAKDRSVTLVTGSPKEMTIDQIGFDLWETLRCYQCSGNDVYNKGVGIKTNDWTLSHEANIFLLDKLHSSRYTVRTGKHFDHRPGLCNFSVIGRNAGPLQRQDYIWFEEMFQERKAIADEFNYRFKGQVMATVAGETGLDITPVGCGKAQILPDFEGEITFFGDKTMVGGNDHDIATALNFKNVNQVDDWRHTWKILLN